MKHKSITSLKRKLDYLSYKIILQLCLVHDYNISYRKEQQHAICKEKLDFYHLPSIGIICPCTIKDVSKIFYKW